jgi:hypothetical protein
MVWRAMLAGGCRCRRSMAVTDSGRKLTAAGHAAWRTSDQPGFVSAIASAWPVTLRPVGDVTACPAVTSVVTVLMSTAAGAEAHLPLPRCPRLCRSRKATRHRAGVSSPITRECLRRRALTVRGRELAVDGIGIAESLTAEPIGLLARGPEGRR